MEDLDLQMEKATEKDVEVSAGLVKIVWSEHIEEALTRIILEELSGVVNSALRPQTDTDES